MEPRRFAVLLTALLATGGLSRAVPGQIPPRRAIGDAPVAAGRTADRADGTALPAWARSIRVAREGEVLRLAPDVESGRRGTATRSARLPALEASQGRGCRGAWVRVGPEAWVCGDGADLLPDAPAAASQPVVREGEVVPYQYAFATHAGVRTYRRLEDVGNDEWAEELERGMALAVVGTARQQGTVYAHTVSGRWVSLRDLAWARPSERAGVLYDADSDVGAVGFLRVDARAWPTPEAALRDRGRAAGVMQLARRDPVHIREERMLRGQAVLRVDAGWVASRHVLRPELPAPPSDLAARERWVDVDRGRQILVALEGARPVMAALVSTGRPGSPTTTGEHRVWAKLATTDMSNVDDASVETATSLYTVARVPWVMFFHADQALHGAFWHDGFGRTHSHGCVNLAPRDAAWLFAWAPPALPPGWTAVMPTPAEPGLRVRVR